MAFYLWMYCKPVCLQIWKILLTKHTVLSFEPNANPCCCWLACHTGSWEKHSILRGARPKMVDRRSKILHGSSCLGEQMGILFWSAWRGEIHVAVECWMSWIINSITTFHSGDFHVSVQRFHTVRSKSNNKLASTYDQLTIKRCQASAHTAANQLTVEMYTHDIESWSPEWRVEHHSIYPKWAGRFGDDISTFASTTHSEK